MKGDIYGGVIAAIVALPLSLAFGVSSGAGPIAGLYGAICIGFFAAIFGGTPVQISGPTGPMTVVMAAIITRYIAKYPEAGLTLAFTVVVMSGVFQILFGFLKLGKYVSMVPYAVISGFMTGIGMIIILIEIPALLGHEVSGGVIPALKAMPEILRNPGYIEAVMGLTVIAIIYLWPKRLAALIPAPLFALIFMAITAAVFLPEAHIHILGDIPTGLPEFRMPTIEPALAFDMVKSAIILALLGSIDSLLTSLVADNITCTQHDPERELIGQGVGNIVAGLFGGLPGAGATMRTVINVNSGGKTPLSGMLHSMILFVVVLGLGCYASYIPHTVLAGILITVGIGISDWEFIRRVHKFPLRIPVIMLTVLAITVFVDLITAVAVGIIMSSLSTIKRMADLQIKQTKEIHGGNANEHLSKKEAGLFKRFNGQVLLYQLHGLLSFGAAKYMLNTLGREGDYKILILDMTFVPMVDVTTALTVETIIKRVQNKQKQVQFVGLQQEVLAQFDQLSISDLVLEEHNHETLDQALKSVMSCDSKQLSSRKRPSNYPVLIPVSGKNSS